jgi:tetratricopeptide (TPR) repeat protein
VAAPAATLLAVSVALASCGGSSGDLKSLLSEAGQAGTLTPSIAGNALSDARLQRAASQPQLCIADYTHALSDFPDLVEAYKGRGDCYLNGGQNGPAAVHDYTEALTLATDPSDILLRRAVGDRVSGNVTAAIADYKAAAGLPAARADQELTAVDGLVAVGDADDARAVYQRALHLDPQSGPLHLAGADVALAAGDDTAADHELTLAQQLATSRSEQAQVLAHVCHADVLRQLMVRAATDCAEAAQLSISGSGAYDDLASAQLALGNPSAALTDINASIGAFIANIGPYSQPTGVDGFGLSNLYVARGWIEVQLHRRADALADFRLAAASLPGAAPDSRARIKADVNTAKVD